MNKKLIERRNKVLRKIPGNLGIYSAFQERKHNSPLLRYGLHTVTSFRRQEYARAGERLAAVETPDQQALSPVNTVHSNSGADDTLLRDENAAPLLSSSSHNL